MSKISIAILFAAIGLITLGTYFQVPSGTSGGGLILVVALCYSFVVAKREMERLSHKLREESVERNAPAGPARMPKEVG